MSNIHDDIKRVEIAISEYRKSDFLPFREFLPEHMLIDVCDHFIKNYHKSMKMSDQQRALKEYYSTDVDF